MLPDRYELHARVTPALILAAPALLVASLFGASPDVPVTGATVFGALLIAVALVGSDTISDAGRSLEERRWGARSGSPTVKALLADNPAGTHRRERIRQLFGFDVARDDRASAERARVRPCVTTSELPVTRGWPRPTATTDGCGTSTRSDCRV